MGIAEDLVTECLFRIAKPQAIRNSRNRGIVKSSDNYVAWREDALQTQFSDHFDQNSVIKKDVLDFGCGSGNLALAIARLGANRVSGVDLNSKAIALAIDAAATGNISVDFRMARRPDAIEFPDNSFDVILCFDVLEHVMEFELIIGEWRRVLRPDGRILIWWSPYFHPYGHHCHSYVPIPWMHVFCNSRIINSVCSKVVNCPEYVPPYWDLDEDGNRRDRFAGSTSFGFLNRLTIARFERLCAAQGFAFLRREFHPLQQLKRVPLAHRFCRLPGMREFLTAFAVYEICVP